MIWKEKKLTKKTVDTNTELIINVLFDENRHHVYFPYLFDNVDKTVVYEKRTLRTKSFVQHIFLSNSEEKTKMIDDFFPTFNLIYSRELGGSVSHYLPVCLAPSAIKNICCWFWRDVGQQNFEKGIFYTSEEVKNVWLRKPVWKKTKFKIVFSYRRHFLYQWLRRDVISL